MICWSRFESLVKVEGNAGSKSIWKGRFCFRDMAEAAFHRLTKIGEGDFLDVDRDGAGLDLRQIQNVVDEVEQIGTGGVNAPGEFDLFVVEVSGRVAGQLLAENE